MKKRIKNIDPRIILVGILLFHLINNYIWLKIDKSYLTLDAWGHYFYSLEVYDFLKNVFHLSLPLSAIEPIRWHGIFVGFATAPFYSVFGSGQDTAVMINSAIFLIVLVLSIYGIGKKLFSKQAGLLAAFLVTAYPSIFNHSRLYMLDLPLTSMVALGIYFLLASDNFSNKKYSLLFGVFLGLGLLVKFNYAVFIAGPLIIVCYRLFIKMKALSKEVNRNTKKNFIYSMIIVIFLCISLYISKWKEMFHRVYDIVRVVSKDITFVDLISGWSSSLLKYTEILISQPMSFLFFIALIVGFWFFVKHAFKNRWLLYLVIIIPWCIQFFILFVPPELMVRYSMPSLPVVAIITSIGLVSIKRRILRRSFISLLIVLGLIQFFAISYGIPLLPEKIKFLLIKEPYDFNLVLFEQKTGISPFLEDRNSHPSSADWKSSQVLNTIISSNTSKERIKVLFLSNIPQIAEALSYQILMKRELIDVMPANIVTLEKFYRNRIVPLDIMCLDADYIIICDNPDSPWGKFLVSKPAWKQKIEKAREVFCKNSDHFKLIELLKLPDGSGLSIYKNSFKTEMSKYSEIKKGDIRFLFDRGRGRIFWKGVEITKRLGLYVSLFSLQHWRDSMEAVWTVRKLSETRLIAEGRWMFLPVSQIWEITLEEGNNINWQVKMATSDKIKIEIEDFKLMLSDRYKNWFVLNKEKGIFPSTFDKDRWRELWKGEIENTIGVEEIHKGNVFLPSVTFHTRETSKDYFVTIENSDELFCGRAIGCFKRNKSSEKFFPPGQYRYFSARIVIY